MGAVRLAGFAPGAWRLRGDHDDAERKVALWGAPVRGKGRGTGAVRGGARGAPGRIHGVAVASPPLEPAAAAAAATTTAALATRPPAAAGAASARRRRRRRGRQRCHRSLPAPRHRCVAMRSFPCRRLARKGIAVVPTGPPFQYWKCGEGRRPRPAPRGRARVSDSSAVLSAGPGTEAVFHVSRSRGGWDRGGGGGVGRAGRRRRPPVVPRRGARPRFHHRSGATTNFCGGHSVSPLPPTILRPPRSPFTS